MDDATDPTRALWDATQRGPVVSYKASRAPGAPPPSKAELAAPACVCCMPRRVAGQLVPMRFGIAMAFCDDHRDPAFVASRGGRDFLAAIGEIVRSLGLRGDRWRRAARAYLDDVLAMATPTPRRRPGSYAWPHLRSAAERVWSAGGSYHDGEAALLALHAPYVDAVRPPSRQTVRRWWRQRRWLTPRPGPDPAASRRTRRAAIAADLAHDRRPLEHLDRRERHPTLQGRRRGPAVPPDTTLDGPKPPG